MKAKIDIKKCEATLHDDNIQYSVTLSNYTVTVYSKENNEVVSEEIIPYDYKEVADGSMNPLVYWIVRGIHGIPLEYRELESEQTT